MDYKQNAFLQMAVPAAQAAQRKWGVPTSVTVAQAILESGWGGSALARQACNYFGIKAALHAVPEACVEFRTAEFVNGKKTSVLAKFAKYTSAREGFDAHASLLATAIRYRPAMAVAADARKFCAQLQACGYSTNPAYAESLWQLIEDFDLRQFDLPPNDPVVAKEVAA